MENVIGKMKATVIVFFTGLTSFLGALAIPVYLLVGANIIDYVTALLAAPYRGEQRTSKKGISGIAKKIGMWLLILVGFLLDTLLAYLTQTMGWAVPFKFAIACIVCIWILVNELISIIENIADLGVEVPFLMPLVKWVKQKAEDSVKISETKS